MPWQWRWHDSARPCFGFGLLVLVVGSPHEHLWTTKKMRRDRARTEGLWVALAMVSSELGSALARSAAMEMHSYALPWLKLCYKRVEVEE
jgi:hypothetical protein